MALTRIHQIAARGGDLQETRSFYQDKLGARYIATYDPPGLLFFEFAGTRILFERDANPATFYFWVDDIDAAHADLKGKGVTFDGEPHMIFRDDDGTFGNPGGEEWMVFMTDPAGNTVALASRR